MIKINLLKEKFKVCSECGEAKELGEFQSRGSGKKRSECKECNKNCPSHSREKMNLYAKKSREKNVGIIRIQRSEKKCFVCGVKKNLVDFVKDKYSSDGRTYECKECRCKSIKEYRNKEKNKEKIRDYDRKRRRENTNVKLHRNVSRMVLQALRNVGASKGGGKTFEKLGYDVFQLKESLEKKFDEKMNWKNYGSYWHIDHVIPKSLFRYETMECEEFRKCWALENLRPLEAKENMRKGNRIEMKKETN